MGRSTAFLLLSIVVAPAVNTMTATATVASGQTLKTAVRETLGKEPVRGINLSGAELNADKSVAMHGKDYIYPPVSDVAYFSTRGFSVVRLPFRWERLQPTFFGALDRSELDLIRNFVATARAHGMKVVLSPHNFGRYYLEGQQVLIGTPRVPNQAFADFWRRVALEFRGDPGIYAFGLMNEPHDSAGLWKATAQAGLDAIRTVDDTRAVFASGDAWSGAWSWLRYNNDFLLDDPAGRLVYEAHQYFDFDHSGTYKLPYRLNAAYPDLGVDLLRPFAGWLREHRARGVIGEFGVPNDDPRWLELADRFLGALARERISSMYWAGGPWWGNYPLSAEPKDGVDAPIMGVLTKKRISTAANSR